MFMSRKWDRVRGHRRWNLAMVSAVAVASFAACSSSKDQGGAQKPPVGPVLSTPVTIHRLTRFEYSNTARDLLGEATPLVDQLPADQQNALGYDNDGASLEISPLLMDRYVTLSGQLVASLFARLTPLGKAYTNIVPDPCMGAMPGVDVCGSVNGGYGMDSTTSAYWGMISAYPGLQVSGITIPAYGTYSVSVQAFATPTTCTDKAAKAPNTPFGQPYPVVLGILIDGKEQTFDVTSVTSAQGFSFAATLDQGQHSIEVRSDPDRIDDDNKDGNWYNQSLWVSGLRIDGPQQAPGAIKAADVVSCGSAAPDSDACMNSLLQTFAARAWRRPVTTDELAALKAVADSVTKDPGQPGTADQKFQAAAGLAIQAALVSPYFIYRPELDPDPNVTGSHPLNDYELASRLSYFLWSSMPDADLFAAAKAGTLHDPKQLDAEVERMLGDPKAAALTQSFAGQWIFTQQVPGHQPDPVQYPLFTADVHASMVTETNLYFQEFLKQGVKLPDMLDADFTFVNSTLASFYGLTNATGATASNFVKVPLDGSHRGGLLTQGGVLMVTSHANRTSPVLRGKFVLGQLLCSSPPPPPANVPPFNEDVTAGSVRQRMEAHAKGFCAGCHSQMDPIGFAMENFDGVGEYRTMDGTYPIDTTGLTIQSQPISDVASLAQVLKKNPSLVSCVAKQLFSYAVGQQEVAATDGTVMTNILNSTAAGGYSLRDIIHAIVQSPAFTQRSGGAK
jgi:hypothetical protein